MKIKYLFLSCLTAALALCSLFLLVKMPLVSSSPEVTTNDGAWVDEFDSPDLEARWSWVREDSTHWSLTEQPGFLRIKTQPGDLVHDTNNMQNLMLTEPTMEDFVITTKVTFDPSEFYQGACLYIYQDDDNFIYLCRQFAFLNRMIFRHERDGVLDLSPSLLETATTLYLRLTKKSNLYVGAYSNDDTNWTELGQYYVEFTDFKIGIGASSGPSDAEIPADFDYFRFEEFDRATLYVAPGGACGGPETCYGTIQQAVDAADEFDLIKVAAGTYSGVSIRPRRDVTTTGVVTQVVYVSKSVDIQGGFSTSDWETFDPETNHTIVDANGQGRAVYITGDIYPIIEGLHITGGDATGMQGEGAFDSDAGGGMYIFNATATIKGNWFYKNTVPDGQGGGLFLQFSDSKVSANNIYSNTASGGGGIGANTRGFLISENTVTGNEASSGGGIFMFMSSGKFSGNRIANNIAGGHGGGLKLTHSWLAIENNLITGNRATFGYGGGIATKGDTDTKMINNVIIDNQAQQEGTALYGAGVRLDMLHNSIGGDTTFERSAVKFEPWACCGGPAVVTMTNNIIVDSDTGIYAADNTTVTVNSILWYNVQNLVVAETGATVTTQNEMTGDPAFAADGYHLTGSSAAIDQGVDAGVVTDIDGENRPLRLGYDLGADELDYNYLYLPMIVK